MRGIRFYSFNKNPDGTVDVFLFPEEAHIVVVKGVAPYEELEDDIRANFYAWCESGEKVNM